MSPDWPLCEAQSGVDVHRLSAGTGYGMSTSADRGERLLRALADLPEVTLVALARRGQVQAEPPSWRGRCLEPDYLAAVAAGAWTLDDEVLLARVVVRAEVSTLPRVARRHRPGLRTALRAASVSLLTVQVPSAGWQARRDRLAQAWESTVGPLPTG